MEQFGKKFARKGQSGLNNKSFYCSIKRADYSALFLCICKRTTRISKRTNNASDEHEREPRPLGSGILNFLLLKIYFISLARELPFSGTYCPCTLVPYPPWFTNSSKGKSLARHKFSATILKRANNIYFLIFYSS